jgi:hypothetical protein
MTKKEHKSYLNFLVRNEILTVLIFIWGKTGPIIMKMQLVFFDSVI